VLPEPPAASTPSQRPSANRPLTTMAAASAITDTARPRSRAAVSASTSTPAAAPTSYRLISGSACGGSSVPTSTKRVLTPDSFNRSRRYSYSAPLVSRVPTRTTVFWLIPRLHFSGGTPPKRAEPGEAGSRRTPLPPGEHMSPNDKPNSNRPTRTLQFLSLRRQGLDEFAGRL